jgi:hypothetical protein
MERETVVVATDKAHEGNAEMHTFPLSFSLALALPLPLPLSPFLSSEY